MIAGFLHALRIAQNSGFLRRWETILHLTRPNISLIPVH